MPNLTYDDFTALEQQLGMSAISIQDRFSKGEINRFTITQLKSIIKYFRQKLTQRWTGPNNRYPLFLTLTGRKANLVTVVQQALAHKEPAKTLQPSKHAPHMNGHQSSFQNGAVNGITNGFAHQPSGVPYQNHYQNGFHHAAYASYMHHHPPIDIETILMQDTFKKNRSPFHVVKQILAKDVISTAKKTDLHFSLDEDIMKLLHHPTNIKMGVFLRLFCANTMQHIGFNQVQVSILVKGTYLTIDTRATNNGIKKKGLEIIKPLEITKHCLKDPTTATTIDIYCQSPFHGIVVAELIQIRSIDDVIKQITYTEEDYQRDLNSDNKNWPKRCGFCGTSKNLLRCSRCKSTWYCGELHQERHWAIHSTECQPAVSGRCEPPYKPRKKRKASAQSSVGSDDECAVVDARCSLRCPLSVGRIKVAAKGANCPHPQCFDLATFVGFCHQTGIWQCPICEKRLPFEELEVNDFMNRILSEVSEEVFQVRVLPDGRYNVVSPEEEKNEESRVRVSKRRKTSRDQSATSPHAPSSPNDEVASSSTKTPSSSISGGGSTSSSTDGSRNVSFLSDIPFQRDVQSSNGSNGGSSASWSPICERDSDVNNGGDDAALIGSEMHFRTGAMQGGTLQSAIVLD